MKFTTTGFFSVLLLGAALGIGAANWYGNRHAAPPVTPASAAPKAAEPKPASPKAIPVEVATARLVSMPRSVSAVGSLRSDNSVMLRPEVTGRIAAINFEEGGKVKKGQVLIRLDDSVDKAQLQQAQANLSLADSQYRRAVQLSGQGFISKQARDEAASQLKVQQAAVALAKARLDKTAIVAPFDGFIGLRNVSTGDYVGPGVDLVPLESVDPLKVDFRIPEQYLSQVREGSRLVLRFDALPGQVREGVVGAISPLVDVGGRSILLRATVPNADASLRPGMFARVQLQFANEQVVVVPETALAPSGEKQYVFVVADGKASRVAVTVGQRRQADVEILSGVAGGDTVIVSGLQKVTDGAQVDARAAAQPDAPAGPAQPAARS